MVQRQCRGTISSRSFTSGAHFSLMIESHEYLRRRLMGEDGPASFLPVPRSLPRAYPVFALTKESGALPQQWLEPRALVEEPFLRCPTPRGLDGGWGATLQAAASLHRARTSPRKKVFQTTGWICPNSPSQQVGAENSLLWGLH